jgi:hypothetical protein
VIWSTAGALRRPWPENSLRCWRGRRSARHMCGWALDRWPAGARVHPPVSRPGRSPRADRLKPLPTSTSESRGARAVIRRTAITCLRPRSRSCRPATGPRGEADRGHELVAHGRRLRGAGVPMVTRAVTGWRSRSRLPATATRRRPRTRRLAALASADLRNVVDGRACDPQIAADLSTPSTSPMTTAWRARTG